MQTSFACVLPEAKFETAKTTTAKAYKPQPHRRRMAIFHLSVKVFSRTAGHSAVAAACYRSGERMTDEKAMTVYDFTRRGGVVSKTMHLPHGLTLTREQVWNEAERAENRKNSTVARECEISLPMELDLKTQIALANELGLYLVEKHGCAADVNVHQPTRKNDPRNTHAHILMTTRRFNPEGVLGDKCRELDAAKTGSLEITGWRAHWAMLCNRELHRAGLETRIDHRSLADQGTHLVPTIHEGTGTSAGLRRAFNEGARASNREAIALDEAIKAALLERAHLVAAQIVADATARAQALHHQAAPPAAASPVAPVAALALTPAQIDLLKISLAAPAGPIEPPQTLEQMRHALDGDLSTLQRCSETARIGRVRLQAARPNDEVAQAKKAAPVAAKRLSATRRAVSALDDTIDELGFFGRIFYKRALEEKLKLAKDKAKAETQAFNAIQALATATSRESVEAVLAANSDTIKTVSARARELKGKIAALEAKDTETRSVQTQAPDQGKPQTRQPLDQDTQRSYPRPRGF